MKRTLKGIRVDMGLTQEDMAKAIGVSKVTWNKKEKGLVPLLATELIKVGQMSGIPIADIEVLK